MIPPSKVAAQLRHIASKLENSINPNRSLVSKDLRKIIAGMDDEHEKLDKLVDSLLMLKNGEGDGISYDEMYSTRQYVTENNITLDEGHTFDDFKNELEYIYENRKPNEKFECFDKFDMKDAGYILDLIR